MISTRRMGLVVLFAGVLGTALMAAEITSHPKTDAYDGWRLGTQAWTFRLFTFYEAIEKTRELGLGWIEAFPGQTVSADNPGVKMDQDMPAELRKQVLEKLEKEGITLVNFGVVGLGENEAQARKVFEFAKEMGVETIVSEPALEQMEMLDKLCQEYKIGLAIHNHPKPSKYWNPETVLKACEGRSRWIGACTDTGHWVRSGLEPVDCLKQLEGRIRSVHLKEIENNTDVVWGTAKGRVKGSLEELHRQGYQGTFSIEYETAWENNLPFIYKSVVFFDKVASGLKPTGWKPLFAEDLSNADFTPAGWTYEQGLLQVKPGSKDIWTKDSYGDFILDVEFKVDQKTNSGVFLRAKDHNWLPWVEVQVVDDYGSPVDRHSGGGIYDILAPTKNAQLPRGQWNRLTILAKGPIVQVVVNSEQTVNMNLDKWTKIHENPDGSPNKFDVAYKDLPRSGFIGLQDHGTKVWCRNLKIRELQ